MYVADEYSNIRNLHFFAKHSAQLNFLTFTLARLAFSVDNH